MIVHLSGPRGGRERREHLRIGVVRGGGSGRGGNRSLRGRARSRGTRSNGGDGGSGGFGTGVERFGSGSQEGTLIVHGVESSRVHFVAEENAYKGGTEGETKGLIRCNKEDEKKSSRFFRQTVAVGR